ncbi:MAG TPA: hypothetical protein VFW50_44280 [Streptosporangiaceae bacterium]|nr:hypothetical protein [Streptosporangiaceae bacterium]
MIAAAAEGASRGGTGPQQRGRPGLVDRPDPQFGQARARRPGIPRRQHDRQGPVGPASGVLDALPGRGVDPLEIVHHGEHRPPSPRGPQHAERGDADGKPVTGRGRSGDRRPERQRAPQGRGLRGRQRRQVAEHRLQQIGQRGERELRLRLGPARPDHRDRAACPLGSTWP